MRRVLKEYDAYLAFLKVGSDDEMGGVLAASMAARQFLLNTKRLSRPFPQDALDGIDAFTAAGRSELNQACIEVGSIQRQSLNSGDVGEILAGGLVVWNFSLKSIAHPEAFARGRLLWRELMRGEMYCLDTAMLLFPGPLEKGGDDFFHPPQFLLTDTVGTP